MVSCISYLFGVDNLFGCIKVYRKGVKKEAVRNLKGFLWWEGIKVSVRGEREFVLRKWNRGIEFLVFFYKCGLCIFLLLGAWYKLDVLCMILFGFG